MLSSLAVLVVCLSRLVQTLRYPSHRSALMSISCLLLLVVVGVFAACVVVTAVLLLALVLGVKGAV